MYLSEVFLIIRFKKERTEIEALICVCYRIKPVILGNGRCIQSDAVISGYSVPKGVRYWEKQKKTNTKTQKQQPLGNKCLKKLALN